MARKRNIPTSPVWISRRLLTCQGRSISWTCWRTGLSRVDHSSPIREMGCWQGHATFENMKASSISRDASDKWSVEAPLLWLKQSKHILWNVEMESRWQQMEMHPDNDQRANRQICGILLTDNNWSYHTRRSIWNTWRRSWSRRLKDWIWKRNQQACGGQIHLVPRSRRTGRWRHKRISSSLFKKDKHQILEYIFSGASKSQESLEEGAPANKAQWRDVKTYKKQTRAMEDQMCRDWWNTSTSFFFVWMRKFVVVSKADGQDQRMGNTYHEKTFLLQKEKRRNFDCAPHKDGKNGKDDLEKLNVPSLSEIIAESMWRSMGVTCDQRQKCMCVARNYRVVDVSAFPDSMIPVHVETWCAETSKFLIYCRSWRLVTGTCTGTRWSTKQRTQWADACKFQRVARVWWEGHKVGLQGSCQG